MNLVKAAAAVLNQTPLAWEENKTNILQAIGQARAQGVSLLCLPELCITGYGCEDAFHSSGVIETAREVLLELLPETQGMVVSLGLPVMHNGSLYNAAALAVDGKLAGLACKQNLAGAGIHYEPRWFKPWLAGTSDQIDLGAMRCPLGDLVFDCGGLLVGFEICEDAWVAQRPGSSQALQGVDVILNPSASHFAFGKQDIRKQLVLEGSRTFHVSYLYANLLGNEAGRAVYSGGAMIASSGKMLSRGPQLSFNDVQLTTAVLDIDATRLSRARSGGPHSDAESALPSKVRAEFEFPETGPESVESESPELGQAAWENGPHVKEEEFARTVALALFDYLRKSRSQGFVVSLSGGADSAAVALLVSLAVELGIQELGFELWTKKLAHIENLNQSTDSKDLVGRLLTCVYQATRNSSTTTRDAARAVAQALGAEFLEFDVDQMVEGYKQIVATAIRRPLDWQTDDLALQNIQARARAPGVWLLANLRGSLLLATSNRSEAAVGYATMDGDTAGGLSPIAGIDKAFLRQWLRWMEETGVEGIGPIPALDQVNQQQPTAELRPASASQTDEDDLMPYDVLDVIERAAIRDKLVPLEVFHVLETRFPDSTASQLGAWVERFFQLWCRNQWKRERYAPSFHLDDENLDPKTWCRFPILSGGYRRELAQLREHLKSR